MADQVLLTRRGALRAGALAVSSGLSTDAIVNPPVAHVTVDWNAVSRVSRTHLSVQVVTNPLLRRGSAIHQQAFEQLKALGADHVRYVPWYPYPRLGVAELAPPTRNASTWDFTHLDPLVVDFMRATAGHAPVLNFSTTPAWMWRTSQPVPVPADPNTIDFGYCQGTELAVAPSEVAAYYRRLIEWYTRGGFTDESGRRHDSPHHFTFDYWEVLNEIDAEHRLSPQLYTELYDEIVSQIMRIAPHTEFVGLALSSSTTRPVDYVRYFLDPDNHRLGVPVHWISYHFYAIPSIDTVAGWGPTAFPRVDAFLATVDRLAAIRAQLSPRTRTAVNEVGTVLRRAAVQPHPGAIPAAYWNFSAAIHAYVVAQLALRGIELVAASQLIGNPGQYPSATMLDWRTGRPNARFRVVQLLLEHLRAGAALCPSRASLARVHGLGFRTPGGDREVLLVNKGHRQLDVRLRGLKGAAIEVVDAGSAGGPPRAAVARHDAFLLPGYAVAIARLAARAPGSR